MSHTATVSVDFKDPDCLKRACAELGLVFREGLHQVRLYQGSVAAEFSVQLPGWQYPIAINGDKVSYDNYGGRWGDMDQFERLQDYYSKHVTIKQAEAMGWPYEEEVDEQTGELIVILYDYS